MMFINEKYPKRVVIRGLPQSITEKVILEKLQCLPLYNHFYFTSTIQPRAYINFNTNTDMLQFIKKYNCSVLIFNDVKYKLCIEIAANQRVLHSKRKKIDSKIGTIESDKNYQHFIENLGRKEKQNPVIPFDFYDKKNTEAQQIITPLLKFILERKSRKDAKMKTECVVFINSTKKKQKKYLNNIKKQPLKI